MRPSQSIAELKRELKQVNAGKPRLVETAKTLALIDRTDLREHDVRKFRGVDGRVVKSVDFDADFRDCWNDIVAVMEVIAPVETRETSDENGAVLFEALAVSSRGELKVEYRADGSLYVKALWAESASASMAVRVVNKTYSL